MTVGTIFAGGHNEAITLLSLEEFLNTDMYKQVILQIILPPLDDETYILKFFKVCVYSLNISDQKPSYHTNILSYPLVVKQ